MQRRLILMRHAKSAWDTDAQTDHDRPLNSRGRRDAPLIAQRLAELGWAPELVLSSDSVRTRETWQRMSEAFERLEIRFLPSLYGAGVEELEEALGSVPPDVATVLALGHNPGWEEVLVHLTGQAERLTTANAALLVTEADSWSAAASEGGGWTAAQILRPKTL